MWEGVPYLAVRRVGAPYGTLPPTQAAGSSMKGLEVTMYSAAAAREGRRVVLRKPPGDGGRNRRVFIRGIA